MLLTKYLYLFVYTHNWDDGTFQNQQYSYIHLTLTSVVTVPWPGRSCKQFAAEERKFSPKPPDGLWSPANLLSIRYWWFFLQEVKRAGCEVGKSLPSSGEVRNWWSYSPTPSICLCLQWRTEGGFGGSTPPSPLNSEGPPKSCQIQPDCENC